MAALDRAVALAEMDAVPVRVEQDLDLDVATAFDEPLEDQPVVTERSRCLAPGRGERVLQAVRGRGRCACPCRRRRRPA